MVEEFLREMFFENFVRLNMEICFNTLSRDCFEKQIILNDFDCHFLHIYDHMLYILCLCYAIN